ncbi:MAG: hypothetical protein ABI895_00345 [Deltaproteobacteria bacterium]
MTEREPGARVGVSIAELRELRRSERAPEALQQRVSERLARDLAGAPRAAGEQSAVAAQDASHVAPQPVPPAALGAARAAGRRGWRPEPRSLALGFAAAALLFALIELRRGAAPSGARELALAPEPAATVGFAPGGARSVPASLTPTASVASSAAQQVTDTEPAAGTRKSSHSSLAEAFAKKLAEDPPHRPVTLGDPAPEIQPGLLRGLPARSFALPGFAVTTQAGSSELPLPPALGPNLVTNGDFSQGTALWSVVRWDSFVGPPSTVRAPFDIVKGALCTTLRGGDLAHGSWPAEDRSLSPHSFELERGQRYRLSLRVWTKGPLPVSLLFKVGHQSEPYAAAVVATVPVTQLPQLLSVAFEPHADDADAGIAFAASALVTPEARLGSSDLCIDDVRVTREARQL